MGRCLTCGSNVAPYSAWRRFTMNVANKMTISPAFDATRLRAMNWLDPANTDRDMNCPCHAASRLTVTSEPKMTPNGAAPTSMGMVSRAPALKLARVVDWVIFIRSEEHTTELQSLMRI